jgi:glucose-6-phosphate isomerase
VVGDRLPIAIAIGAENFRDPAAGCARDGRALRAAPVERNLPMLLGLLDVWYRNFHGFGSRCVAPYHQGLKRLPAYLQQLEMESNGKRVDARARRSAMRPARSSGASPAPTASTPTSRCCTRART